MVEAAAGTPAAHAGRAQITSFGPGSDGQANDQAAVQ
jgi:hypothetical protein